MTRLDHRRPLNFFAPELGPHQPSWWMHVLVIGIYGLLVVAALELGNKAGANCIAVRVWSGTQYADLRMGFWCELNHGPLYLLGAPLFYLFTMSLIARANNAFAELSDLNRLRAPLHDLISGRGTKIGWVVISLAILAVVSVMLFRFELGSRECTRQIVMQLEPKSEFCAKEVAESAGQDTEGRRPEAVMGWVQAQYLSDWVTALNQKRIRNEQIETNPKIKAYDKIEVRQGGAAKNSRQFIIFLILGLGVQSILLGLAFWALFKIVWIMYWIWRLFSGRSGSSIRPVPFFLDPQKRFGLGQLDDIYKAMMTLVISAGLALYLNIANNVAKGTAVITPGSHQVSAFQDLFGQLLLWVLPLVLAGLILFIPPLFARYFREEREQLGHAIKTMIASTQLAAAGNSSDALPTDALNRLRELGKLEESFFVLDEQRSWPKEDRIFSLQTGAVILFFLILPVSIIFSAAAAVLVTEPVEALSDSIGAVLKLPEVIKQAIDIVREFINTLCDR